MRESGVQRHLVGFRPAPRETRRCEDVKKFSAGPGSTQSRATIQDPAPVNRAGYLKSLRIGSLYSS